ncbi:hypothetical protein ACHAW5_007142 [Stephanodiscus triporus]|uniref:Mei2-like C-terminal RNA recognition motif domain-containing protein n=1 Tax=Stephanodiscus triporus TaxID=2934178 RepID=A0ABD3RBA5_9STRA
MKLPEWIQIHLIGSKADKSEKRNVGTVEREINCIISINYQGFPVPITITIKPRHVSLSSLQCLDHDFLFLPPADWNWNNRGYAFLNFINYKDIIQFSAQYIDCEWKTNRSGDDIMYARIQPYCDNMEMHQSLI